MQDGWVRILSIEPLSTLAAEQAELLDEMLVDHPELVRDELLVYWVGSGKSRKPLVAPPNAELRPGMGVIAVGWKLPASASSGFRLTRLSCLRCRSPWRSSLPAQ